MDDLNQPKDLTPEQMMALSAIALLTPALGGAMGGKQGALLGASAGAKAGSDALTGIGKDQKDKRDKLLAADLAEKKRQKERDEDIEDFKTKESYKAKLKPDKASEKAVADVAKNFEGDFAKKTQIASVIDQELAKFKEFMDAGNKEMAVRQGEGMLKALNSAFGADAVGAEEAKRLGGFLQRFKAPWEPGSMTDYDLDLFYEQVKAKSDALKGAASDSLSRATTARGGGLEALSKPASQQTPQVNIGDVKIINGTKYVRTQKGWEEQ